MTAGWAAATEAEPAPGSGSPRGARPDATRALTTFARALSGAGLPACPDRTAAFLTAANCLDVTDRDDLHRAGRATLTADRDQQHTFDQIFEMVFGSTRRTVEVAGPASPTPPSVLPDTDSGSDGESGPDDAESVVRALASSREVLRQQDIAGLDAADLMELWRLMNQLQLDLPTRRSRRPRAQSRGRIDHRRTLRSHLRTGGEPALPAHRGPRSRSRRVVLLIDVSGSMQAYAETLLRFAHVWCRRQPGNIEVFTIGTRLTRVTGALHQRDPEAARRSAASAIPDYSGGTRLGEMVEAFLNHWGRRGTARGAVVVIFSDGWENGGPELLAEQVGRLSRLARSLIWVNPHKGRDGYEPVQRGIAAVLPFLDQFLAGHSLDTLQQLAGAVRDA